MLQVKNICKKYITGELIQTALDDVSLNFRDNEFVAILGPSGSGKTTLLNIVGGLDRYNSGDLIINGISTKKYKSRDWDSYRNHTIGFVFQSYNLIPHQSVLSNVELALTISGVSKGERKKRAKEALEKVGLIDHIHKRPNQLSGGQMQRVAIARALVNDPDILLADEPTGALDSETSLQVMDLLKEVAKDRLVIMVTHNPELAENYSTRIVKLKDGKITSDSNPFIVEESKEEPVHKKMGRTSMSFLTSLALSFNNLRTKKGRTILTSFAGSIGIIGIALILSISNGVNNYITDIQKNAMSSYPITIDAQSLDLSSLLSVGSDSSDKKKEHKKDAVYSDNTRIESISAMTSSITKNNLTKFKKYLDDKDSEIHKYVGENGIVYSYATKFGAYSFDTKNELVNLDGSSFTDKSNEGVFMMAGMSQDSGTSGFGSVDSNSISTGMPSASNNLSQLIPGEKASTVSKTIKENYDLVYGEYPDSYDEVVLVLDKNNEVPLTMLYELGLMPASEYRDILKKIGNYEKIEFDTKKFSYEDICKKELYLIPACDYYKKTADGKYKLIDDKNEITDLAKKSLKLRISGVIRLSEDSDNGNMISSALGYTKALTDYLITYAENSDIVKEQKKSKDVNILNGMKFSAGTDAEKIADTKKFLESLGVSEKAKMLTSLMNAMPQTTDEMKKQFEKMNESQLAAQFDTFMKTAPDEVLLTIYKSYITTGTLDDNLTAFGVVSYEAPSSIAIYVDSFENKDNVAECIRKYNEKASEDDKIVYTDYIGLLLSSVTTIVDVISYVLIAFVAVSLIVSSIMIGIITYISVLERTKEIGILRAIGASKKNISRVFNAETFIIGLCAGLIGIGLTLLMLIPGNALIHSIAGTNNVNASLPIPSAVVLIGLSILLTLIGGLIPAKKAAKQDPVKALRTE